MSPRCGPTTALMPSHAPCPALPWHGMAWHGMAWHAAAPPRTDGLTHARTRGRTHGFRFGPHAPRKTSTARRVPWRCRPISHGAVARAVALRRRLRATRPAAARAVCCGSTRTTSLLIVRHRSPSNVQCATAGVQQPTAKSQHAASAVWGHACARLGPVRQPCDAKLTRCPPCALPASIAKPAARATLGGRGRRPRL